MAPGPACVAKFSLEWMLTLDSFYKREVPSRSVTSRDGELLIAGLHRFDLHRDLFHRVIKRACGACLPVRLSSSAALAGPTLPHLGNARHRYRSRRLDGDGAGLLVVFNHRIVNHRLQRRNFASGDIAGFHILRLVDELDKLLRQRFVFTRSILHSL